MLKFGPDFDTIFFFMILINLSYYIKGVTLVKTLGSVAPLAMLHIWQGLNQSHHSSYKVNRSLNQARRTFRRLCHYIFRM